MSPPFRACGGLQPALLLNPILRGPKGPLFHPPLRTRPSMAALPEPLYPNPELERSHLGCDGYHIREPTAPPTMPA
jgi:hypothetical protein